MGMSGCLRAGADVKFQRAFIHHFLASDSALERSSRSFFIDRENWVFAGFSH